MFVNAHAGVFQNYYITLDACKRGFMAGCRPIIGIDGCHIKNRFGGVMLAAVGVNPNDCIYPISIAIVEVEDTSTWKWFLTTLKDNLGIENTRPWTFMSDMQKGLINAVNAIWPEAQHRFCVRHLHQNFARNGFRGDILKNKLWQIARATRQCDWQKYMDELKALDAAAFDYLDAIDPRQWCMAFFEELPKCDLLLNNICEVFNRYILDAREMPIVTSLKKIKDQIMLRYFSKRKELDEMCGNICLKIRKSWPKILTLHPTQHQAPDVTPEAEPQAQEQAQAQAQAAEPQPIQIVLPDEELDMSTQPSVKLPVRIKNSAKKKVVHQIATSATANVVESAMNYSVTSSSVIQVLQEQAISTHLSQTTPPGPIPESQFIASCRGDLPPPRPPTRTLGLKKRKKQQVTKKKENQVPNV